MLACEEREAMVMAPPSMCDSAVLPCFHGCLVFLHRHFPPQSPPSHPLHLSLGSQQQPLPWSTVHQGFLHNPWTPAPSLCAFQGTCIPVWGMYDCGKDCLILILILFRLPQVSCFTLSLKMFLLWPRQLPLCGVRTPASVPLPAEGRPSPTNIPVSPLVPLSCRVVCGSICSFPLVRYSCPLSAGVLHALLCLKVCSWCIGGETCTPRPPTPLPFCSHAF